MEIVVQFQTHSHHTMETAMLKHVDSQLHEWTDYQLRHQTGGLGYKRQSPLGHLQDYGCAAGGERGPNHPTQTLPRHLKPIDQVISRFPRHWLVILDSHYLTRGIQGNKARHYKNLNLLLHVCEGGLTMVE